MERSSTGRTAGPRGLGLTHLRAVTLPVTLVLGTCSKAWFCLWGFSLIIKHKFCFLECSEFQRVKQLKGGGTWPAQREEPVGLDPRVMALTPTLVWSLPTEQHSRTRHYRKKTVSPGLSGSPRKPLCSLCPS